MARETCPHDDPPGGYYVLIVDDEEQMCQVHKINLERWHYRPVIARGAGEKLLRDAVAKARKYRCPVALVDMRLLNDHDTAGLDLVAQLQPTRSIIVSGYGSETDNVVKAIKEKGAFTFVAKGDKPDKIRQAIHNALCEADRCRARTTFEWPRSLSSAKVVELFFPDDPKVPANEADDVLGRLFLRATTLKLEILSGASRTPSLAPRQRSIVLQVWEDNRQPVVVKLARAPRIEADVKHYHDFIDGQLTERYHARLENSVVLWDLGGAVYTFLGSSFGQMRPFSHYYTSARPKQIQHGLEQLFGKTWAGHYSQNRRMQGKSLFAAYSDVWGQEWHTRLFDYPNQAREMLFAFPAGARHLPNPVAWVINRVGLADTSGGDASYLPAAMTAVTHGDMQGDNIFVDSNGAIWVIDYERTGYGPILQDFTELEADILVRLAGFPAEDLTAYHELVCAIVQPQDLGSLPAAQLNEPEAAKALGVIRELRRLTHQQTNVTDARHYLWGLLFNSVFRLTLLGDEPESKPQRDRALLLGGIICERLDHWGTSWPLDLPSPVEPANRSRSMGEGPLATTSRAVTRRTARTHFSNGYGLLIGVGAMMHEPAWSLPVTVRDARQVYEALVDTARCAYPEGQVHLLHDGTATANQIQAGLHWLAEQSRRNTEGTMVVYFSGHGWQRGDGRYALLPSDANPAELESSVLWSVEFAAALREIEARRLLVLIDACHAEAMATAKQPWSVIPPGFSKTPPPAMVIQALMEGEGRAVISSSRGQQSSYVRRDGALSIFTHHLLEALHGAANQPGDTTVRVSNLINHLGKTVAASTRQEWQADQTPWTDQASEDFAIALLLGGKGLPARGARRAGAIGRQLKRQP